MGVFVVSSTAGTPLPDLTVSISRYTGEQIVVDVKNHRNAAVVPLSGWNVRLSFEWLAKSTKTGRFEPVGSRYEVNLTELAATRLGPGTPRQFRVNSSSPEYENIRRFLVITPPPTGQKLRVTIDSDNAVVETNERNNVVVTDRPPLDLSVTSAKLDDGHLRFKLRNAPNGTVPLPYGSLPVRFQWFIRQNDGSLSTAGNRLDVDFKDILVTEDQNVPNRLPGNGTFIVDSRDQRYNRVIHNYLNRDAQDRASVLRVTVDPENTFPEWRSSGRDPRENNSIDLSRERSDLVIDDLRWIVIRDNRTFPNRLLRLKIRNEGRGEAQRNRQGTGRPLTLLLLWRSTQTTVGDSVEVDLTRCLNDESFRNGTQPCVFESWTDRDQSVQNWLNRGWPEPASMIFMRIDNQFQVTESNEDNNERQIWINVSESTWPTPLHARPISTPTPTPRR